MRFLRYQSQNSNIIVLYLLSWSTEKSVGLSEVIQMALLLGWQPVALLSALWCLQWCFREPDEVGVCFLLETFPLWGPAASLQWLCTPVVQRSGDWGSEWRTHSFSQKTKQFGAPCPLQSPCAMSEAESSQGEKGLMFLWAADVLKLAGSTPLSESRFSLSPCNLLLSVLLSLSCFSIPFGFASLRGQVASGRAAFALVLLSLCPGSLTPDFWLACPVKYQLIVIMLFALWQACFLDKYPLTVCSLAERKRRAANSWCGKLIMNCHPPAVWLRQFCIASFTSSCMSPSSNSGNAARTKLSRDCLIWDWSFRMLWSLYCSAFSCHTTRGAIFLPFVGWMFSLIVRPSW